MEGFIIVKRKERSYVVVCGEEGSGLNKLKKFVFFRYIKFKIC